MLGKLITNTLTGALQAPLAGIKTVAGVALAPLDEGETMTQGAADLTSAVRKIGSTRDNEK
jgi:hypothetical protein